MFFEETAYEKVDYKYRHFCSSPSCGLRTPFGDLDPNQHWCLTAPSHSLKQCWLIISKVWWHLSRWWHFTCLSMHKDIKSKTTDTDRASLTRHISLCSMQSFGNMGASRITTENVSFFPLWWSLWQRLRALIRISIPTTLKFNHG